MSSSLTHPIVRFQCTNINAIATEIEFLLAVRNHHLDATLKVHRTIVPWWWISNCCQFFGFDRDSIAIIAIDEQSVRMNNEYIQANDDKWTEIFELLKWESLEIFEEIVNKCNTWAKKNNDTAMVRQEFVMFQNKLKLRNAPISLTRLMEGDF